IASGIMPFIDKTSMGLLVAITTIGQNAVIVGLLVLWPYTGELYSTSLRAMAVGWASSWARAASMVAPLVVGAILSVTRSVTFTFLLFTACTFVLILMWLLFCEETKGRRLDQEGVLLSSVTTGSDEVSRQGAIS